MKAEVELTEEQKSEVKEIYRMQQKGVWYQSETAQAGYTLYYYATKVRVKLYYKDKASAQAEADKYNKRRAAYEKGRQPDIIPENLEWEMFSGTELQNPLIWWHNNGSWLYAHGYTDWNTNELLTDDMDYAYDDFDHSTRDFFDVMFRLPRFSDYELREKDGKYAIYAKLC